MNAVLQQHLKGISLAQTSTWTNSKIFHFLSLSYLTWDSIEIALNETSTIFLSAFLVSELEASRMILVNKPEKKSQESGSPVFQELKGICMALGMSKPPANITMFQFFSGIEKKVSWSGATVNS